MINNDIFFPTKLINNLNYFNYIINNKLYSTQLINIDKKFNLQFLNKNLASPIGVAAGPHTQLTQNIVYSWISGARYFELKTIQTLDEIEVSKPCIDMYDEGYNCEWSQELKIEQSLNEYINAWIIIHYLNYKYFKNQNPEIIFNMSIGYDFEGILKPNVQYFLKIMKNAGTIIQKKISKIKTIFPDIENVKIPNQISDNVTLSTMHGCPPNEIENIGKYLIKEKKIHTIIKLNPTLLGKNKINEILYQTNKYKTNIPDIAFEHDLKYNEAVKITENLKNLADKNNIFFGLKLTNTLESENHRNVFDKSNKMMYMSGKALHPISIELARKLQNDFDGELHISFSGGVDAFNVNNILASGLLPITVCSDLLKPGGYHRLLQYYEEINRAYKKYEANTISQYIQNKSEMCVANTQFAAIANLNRYADDLKTSKYYKKDFLFDKNIKTKRNLNEFDCIAAPCISQCATDQNIPQYIYEASKKNYQKAINVITESNSLPNITGTICDHQCQNKCTRMNFDEELKIREIKHYIAKKVNHTIKNNKQKKFKVAVIGAGPAGLSATYYLNKNNIQVDIYEENKNAGGLVDTVIPDFRIKNQTIKADINNILNSNVQINYNSKINKEKLIELKNKYNYVIIAAGAAETKKLKIKNIESEGIYEPINLLQSFKNKSIKNLKGKNIIVLGGGNTAMDVARAANRLKSKDANLTILYRRTINQMPADRGEIKAVLQEDINIVELVNPIAIKTEKNKIKAIECEKMQLGELDQTGRQKPIKISDSNFIIDCDILIPAIGQLQNSEFINFITKNTIHNYTTNFNNVFAIGDFKNGASTVIQAVADGKNIAKIIAKNFNIKLKEKIESKKDITIKELLLKRTKRQYSKLNNEYTENDLIEEAKRCLYCDEICNICVTVCPNLANFYYTTENQKYKIPEIIKKGNNYKVAYNKLFEITQKYQIINIADWCNHCGNCNTFCPTNSAPYIKKPHIHLSSASYEQSDSGFLFVNAHTLHCKIDNTEYILNQSKNMYKFSCKDFIIETNKKLKIKNYKILNPKLTHIILKDFILSKIIFTELKVFNKFSKIKS